MINAIAKNKFNLIGELLHENWVLKRGLSAKVSNSTLDEIYQKAISEGALGGKLIGAGSGGCFLFYVPVERQEKFKQSIDEVMTEIPFKFEDKGAEIIF